MSMIKELSIQGIRSFGGKSEDMQLIEFSSPVTLILGENGCGKTTIIECIKYALTGEPPPGSSHGHYFVHDPNIFGLSESLGQVKLKIRNIRDEDLTVSRCMKLHYERGNFKFETMDARICYGDGSSSKKCSDVDVDMCQFIGVSKTIINNVIFCNQENCNWPVDNPKNLKEKFDAIFSSKDYIKAIQKFIDMRNDQVHTLRKKEITLQHFSNLKKEMRKKEIELQEAYRTYSSIKEQCDKIFEDIKPINKRLEEIIEVECQVNKQQSLKAVVETKKKTLSERMSRLKTIITKPFEGSIQELETDIRSLREKISEKRLNMQELKDTIASLPKQEKNIQLTLLELEKRSRVLLCRKQIDAKSTEERTEKIHEICTKLNIDTGKNLKESPEAVPAILQIIAKSLQVEEKRVIDQQLAYEEADQEKQKQTDELRETTSKFETEIEHKKNQRGQWEIDLRRTKKEIKINSLNLLNGVTDRINLITEQYEKLSKAKGNENLQVQIEKKKSSIVRLKEKNKDLNTQLTFLNLIKKIHLKEEELEKKEERIKIINDRQKENLKNILDLPVESNVKTSVQTVYNKLQRRVKQLSTDINNLKLNKTFYEIQKKTKKTEPSDGRKLQCEKEEHKIKVKCLSPSNNHETLVEPTYKRYKKGIEEEASCSLYCNPMLETEDTSLIAEVTKKSHHLENSLKIDKQNCNSSTDLRSSEEEAYNADRNIPNCQNEIKELENNIARITSEIESCQKLRIETFAKMELANSILDDMKLLDEATEEVKRLNADLSAFKEKIPENSETVSIEDVKLEISLVMAQLKNKQEILNKQQIECETANDLLNQLLEKKNELEDIKIELKEDLQSMPILYKRKTELSKQIETITKEIIKLKQDLQPIKNKLDDLLVEKQNSKRNNRKILDEMEEKLEYLENLNQDIQRLNQEITDMEEVNLDEEINDLKSLEQRYKEELLQKSNERQKATQELEKLKDEIRNLEIKECDLRNNLDLKELESEAKILDVEIEELSKLLSELDFSRLSQEKEQVAKKNEQFVMERNALFAEMTEIEKNIIKLKGEIDAPECKNFIENYRKSFYEVEVIKRTISDLEQCRFALEHTLTKFHAKKMEEINRLIREYWRQIYRGNDIDYIQIQRHEIQTNASAGNLRSFNYSVIQSMNNSKIEMRGRCSVSQKILASLIIRMAIVETFSPECGILVLDEPTVNLDSGNKKSFCEVLNRIVNERYQQNFLLVISTHDEEFVSMLRGIQLYYHVLRNEKGKSVIRQVKIG